MKILIILKGTLYLDGKEIASGDSTEVEGHPTKAVKWLISEIKNITVH